MTERRPTSEDGGESLRPDASLARSLARLAESVVDENDVVEMLHLLVGSLIELLPVDEAGVLLLNSEARLELVVCTSRSVEVVELFQLEAAQGPCVDAVVTGAVVGVDDLAAEHERWPGFVARARQEGIAAVHAVPMRLGAEVVGVVNLFARASGPLVRADLDVARGLVEITTAVLIQERALGAATGLADQLQRALDTRVLVEQAKGALAERGEISMSEAFGALRDHARRRRRRLADVARDVAERRLSASEVLGGVPGPSD